jgi:hypothetical protein
MWGGIVGLIIQLIAGGVGGNVAGAALKQYNLGTVGNTIAGVAAWARRLSGRSSAAERELPRWDKWPRYRLDYRSSSPAGSAGAS